jgi:hypothetical protein
MIAFQKVSQSTTFDNFQSGESGLIVDCSNGDVTITMPTAEIDKKQGMVVYVAKSDSTLNSVYVVKSDGSSFNGHLTSIGCSNPYQFLILIAAGSDWRYAWRGYANWS